MILLQGFAVDVAQFVPPVVSAVTTIALFVVAFVVIYVLGRYFATRAVEVSLERRGFDDTLVGLAVSVTVGVTAVMAVALAATVAGFGVVLAAFATLAGALALAVGFAAQDLIANFVAGVFIIQDEPFSVGDWIEWDGNSGVVREIQLRVTKLDTFDNELVTVPNSDLATAAVVNNVANDRRRVAVDFGSGTTTTSSRRAPPSSTRGPVSTASSPTPNRARQSRNWAIRRSSSRVESGSTPARAATGRCARSSSRPSRGASTPRGSTCPTPTRNSRAASRSRTPARTERRPTTDSDRCDCFHGECRTTRVQRLSSPIRAVTAVTDRSDHCDPGTPAGRSPAHPRGAEHARDSASVHSEESPGRTAVSRRPGPVWVRRRPRTRSLRAGVRCGRRRARGRR
jgi:hypothetical protein